MNARRLGQNVLDRERRDDILKSIAEARAIAGEVDERVAALPAWAKAPGSPLGEDLQKLLDAGEQRKRVEPVVTRIEQRLSTGGPLWTVLTGEEKAAFDQWIAALAMQDSVLVKHAPTEWEKDVRRMVLLALSVGAIFSPLLWTEESGDARAGVFPLRFPQWHLPGTRPPMPPPGIAPMPAPRVIFTKESSGSA